MSLPCARPWEGQGAQRMVYVAAGATPAAEFRAGSPFLALLEETFSKLAEAHAAELQRVQLGGELRTSCPDDDTTIPEARAVAALSMPVPSMEEPRKRPPQTALRTNSRLDDPPTADVADDERASDEAQGGKASPALTHTLGERPPCKSNSTLEESEDEVIGDFSNSVTALDASMVLARKAMDSDIELHAIEVTITSAGDLRDADLMLGAGTSDPYCVCQIKGKPDTRFQTRVINDNCHPVWNHHRVVMDFEEGDILEFQVFDSDLSVKYDDLLGWAYMESDMHFPQGFDGILDLTVPKRYRSHATSTLAVKVVARDRTVEPDDDRAMEALQLLLDTGAKLWPELCPSSHVSLELKLHTAATGNFTLAHLPTFQAERSTGVAHGTILKGRGRLEKAIVMNPHGAFQACWDMFSLFCVMSDLYQVPFVLAFDHVTPRMKFVSAATTIFWSMDLGRSFLCGYYHDGIIEMRLKRVMMRYLKSWFVLDFSLVAVDWVGLFMEASPSMNIPKMVRFLHILRAARVLSVIRVAKVVVRIERVSYGVRAEAMRSVLFLAVCMFIMIVGCHILACGFYRLGLSTTPEGVPGWVLRDEVDAQGVMYSYTTSVHWAFTQFMPASSGINPGNVYERSYVLLVNILGFVCFSFFVSNVQMQLQGLRKMTADSRQRDALLRRFFNDHEVSITLSNTIFSYINQCAAAKKRTLRESEVQVLKTLPREMHVQLRFEMYWAVVKSHSFFMGLMDVDMVCFRRLCHGAMTEMALEPGEEVFIRGGKAHSMYFISGGHVVYKRPGLSFDIKVGDWAGEPVLWFPSWTHRGNLHTVSAADFVQLSAATFATLVFARHASAVRKAYVRTYAAAFVRGGESDIPMLHHSDVWSNAAAIEELATQCMYEAKSMSESQLAELSRDSHASESESV